MGYRGDMALDYVNSVLKFMVPPPLPAIRKVVPELVQNVTRPDDN